MQQNISKVGEQEIPAGSVSVHRQVRWLAIALTLLVLAFFFGCTAPTPDPVQVEAKAPQVSYKFYTDEDLIEANDRARDYCNRYASTPRMKGTITENQDGTKLVTFKCIQNPANPPVSFPDNYTYTTDYDLLNAMQAADAYCAQTGQVASYNITTSANGTQTMTYRCVPR